MATQPRHICTFRTEGEDEGGWGGTHLHKVRRNVGYLSYPRGEEEPAAAAASHFTPSGRTCRQPPRRNVRWRLQEGDHEGGRTTQGDSLSRSLGTPRKPSDRLEETRTLPA